MSCAGEGTAPVPAETGPDQTRGEVRLPSALVVGVWLEAGWEWLTAPWSTLPEHSDQFGFLIILVTACSVLDSNAVCLDLQVTTHWIIEPPPVPSRLWWRTPSTPGTVCSALLLLLTHWAEVQPVGSRGHCPSRGTDGKYILKCNLLFSSVVTFWTPLVLFGSNWPRTFF